MARPDCPSCGSAQVVPVLHGVHAAGAIPTVHADGLAAGAVRDGFDDRVCGDCGARWSSAELTNARPDGATTLVPFRPRAPSEPNDLDRILRTGDAEDFAGPTEGGAELIDVPATLRRGRERRGESFQQVARATKIWTRYLCALEEDAPLETYPGDAYAGFFLREYAQYLGLDPDPLLRSHRTLHAAEETTPDTPTRPLRDPRHGARVLGRVLAVVSAAVLVAAMLVPQIFRDRSPEARAGSPAGRSGSRTPASAASADRQPPDLIASHTVRELTVVVTPTEPCWVQAVVDGRATLTRTLGLGERTRLHGNRTVSLALGNAGGVTVTVNGEPVRTGAPGEVVHLTLRLRDGVVRMLRA